MWEEDTDIPAFRVPDEVQDVVFRLKGNQLPSDYALALFRSLNERLPWLDAEPNAGIHLATVGEEGNGWYRESSSETTIYLPKRSRLMLRVQREQIAEAIAIAESTLDLDGFSIQLGEGDVKPLSAITTLYARNVVSEHEDEAAFIAELQQMLKALNIRCKKMLCGKTRSLMTPSGKVETRSVMLADLSIEYAIAIQQQGLGPYRYLGCGFFVPHKSINSV